MLLNLGQRFIPMLGTGAFFVETGRKLHNVPDAYLGKALRGDLDFVCEGATWTAAVAFSNGRVAFVPRSAGQPSLPLDQMEKMTEIAVLANREVHHGGHWVIAVSNDVLSALWRDWAGDLQLENTFNDAWARLKDNHPTFWVETLEAVYAEGAARLAAVTDPSKQIFRALGERPQKGQIHG